MGGAGGARIEVSSPTCVRPPIDGRVPSELVEKALKPLWACWRALFAARQKRDPLELDLPERRGMSPGKGRLASLPPPGPPHAPPPGGGFIISPPVARPPPPVG